MFTIQRSRLLFLIVIIFFVGIFSFFSNVSAATNVTEDVAEDTTWTKANSPYIIENSIAILPNITLTIEPGVVVKFRPNFSHSGISLNVLGKIIANGTEAEKIYFTSNFDDEIGGNTDDEEFCYEETDEEGHVLNEICESFDLGDPIAGDWGEIYFLDSTGSSFQNVSFSYAHDTLTLDSSSAEFKNVNLSDSIRGISLYDGNLILDNISIKNIEKDALEFDGGVAELRNIIVENVASGDALGFYDDSLDVSGFTVKNIGRGAAVGVYGGTATIANSTFEGGLDAGIEIYGGSFNLQNSLISGYPSGDIALYGGVSTLDRLKIEDTNYGLSIYEGVLNFSRSSFREIAINAMENYSSGQTDARQNFWGDPSGPYEADLNPLGLGYPIYGDILFDPWLTRDPFLEVECCSSVLFLPGLKASRLYTPRASGSEDQLWEPNGNSDVEYLYLNTDGTSKNSNIYTEDIIKETNVPTSGSTGQNIYKSFSEMMNVLFDEHKIGEWKEFAYDWRQSVDDIVNNGTKYQNDTLSLVDTLQLLVDSSKNGKVTIIAHSNGGLLAKALLEKLQDDKNAGVNNLIDSVDVLILIAVPEIGTASAVPAIMHGYEQSILGGWLLDKTRAREIGRNMLGAFGLLPSKAYIDHVSASPATFADNAIPSNITTKLVQTFGGAISSYDEYKSFLFGGEGRVNPAISATNLPISLSESLFSKAETLHNGIDAFVPPASMRVIEVAGWGLDTVASMEYYPKLVCAEQGLSGACGHVMDQKPRFTADGDGTVVVPSAHYMNFLGQAEKYWVNLPFYNDGLKKNRDHANILEVNPVLDFISNIIQNNDEIDPSYISTTVPVDPKNRFRISIHSPATLDAYDSDGNHTGKICSSNSDFCYVEENIPNSSYLEFGEGKYISVPEDRMSKIKLQGTDIGTFTYESEKVLPNGTSTTSSFVDIPVTTQTQAEIILNQTTQNPELKLDVTGDGVTDFTLLPNPAFDPVAYLQIMKATINSLDLPQAKKNAFNKRVDSVIKSIEKGKIDKAKLKADKFKSALEKKLSKPDPKKPKPKKLSKTDAQLLLDMLNKLLDNIS